MIVEFFFVLSKHLNVGVDGRLAELEQYFARRGTCEHRKILFKLSEAVIDSDREMLCQDNKSFDHHSSSADGWKDGVGESAVANPGDGDDVVAEGGSVDRNRDGRSSLVHSHAFGSSVHDQKTN